MKHWKPQLKTSMTRSNLGYSQSSRNNLRVESSETRSVQTFVTRQQKARQMKLAQLVKQIHPEVVSPRQRDRSLKSTNSQKIFFMSNNSSCVMLHPLDS